MELNRSQRATSIVLSPPLTYSPSRDENSQLSDTWTSFAQPIRLLLRLRLGLHRLHVLTRTSGPAGADLEMLLEHLRQ